MAGRFAKPAPPATVAGMSSWIYIGAALGLVLFCVWWPMRDYVRIRRKDCCGKGCGCLFPGKPPEEKK
jgi:hypothetical protein